jgi:hypothetical protein
VNVPICEVLTFHPNIHSAHFRLDNTLEMGNHVFPHEVTVSPEVRLKGEKELAGSTGRNPLGLMSLPSLAASKDGVEQKCVVWPFSHFIAARHGSATTTAPTEVL